MNSIATLLLSWLLLYKYALLLVVFFLSALALPLPGNTILLASGAFVSQGYMNPWLVLASVFAGNVLGDLSGYWLARRYGEVVIDKLRIKRSYLSAVEQYVRMHPGPTIFLSRFGGSLDPVVNVLAGLVDVPAGLFLAYDASGNIVSLGLVLYLGYTLGDYWQSFSGVISIVGWIMFVILALIALVVIFRKQLRLTEISFVKRLLAYVRTFTRRKM